MGTSSSVLGHWEGEAITQGDKLKIRLHFTSDSQGMIDIPNWTTLGWPLSKIVITQSALHFEMPGNKHTDIFEGHFQGDTLIGEFQFWDKKAQFLAHRVPPEAAKPYTTQDVQFHSQNVILQGTLFLPRASAAYPVVLFTHCSGEETRDRNRFLADHFARKGIASLIYDKRGTGRSTGDWQPADFEDLASDALAGIQFLKTNPQVSAGKIGIFGHSQGGWIAMLSH